MHSPRTCASGGRDELIAAALLLRAKPAGNDKYIARCPAHADRTPSLSMQLGRDGRLLLHCFAGCAFDVVRRAIFGSPRPQRATVQRQRLRPQTPIYRPEPELLLRFHELPLAGSHPYLASKGIPPIDGSDLLVPMFDAAGVLRNVQRIYTHKGGLIRGGRLPSTFRKAFLTGVSTRGLFLDIGKPTARVHIAEGYATACSTHLITNEQSFAVFSAGNLRALRQSPETPAASLSLRLRRLKRSARGGSTAVLS